MSDFSHIARPYAKAVFELARESNDLAGWSDQLTLIATIVNDPQMAGVINNPMVDDNSLIELVLGVAGDTLTSEAQNLVRLMVGNERLAAAGELGAQYQVMRDEAEQVVEAQLITAAEIDDAQKAAMTDALSKRLGKSVKLTAEVDESLLGGAVVRAGDWVVDGSVKAQLTELVGALSH